MSVLLFPPELYKKTEELANILLLKKYILVTAESCTGGLIAALCTEISGSSAWFHGGLVAYDNLVKQRALEVAPEVLCTDGAVSEKTVLSMAHGALAHIGGTVSVAVSGVAGPTGGTVEKPVGTVWIAVARTLPNALLMEEAHHYLFPGSRHQIRMQAVNAAIDAVIKICSE